MTQPIATEASVATISADVESQKVTVTAMAEPASQEASKPAQEPASDLLAAEPSGLVASSTVPPPSVAPSTLALTSAASPSANTTAANAGPSTATATPVAASVPAASETAPSSTVSVVSPANAIDGGREVSKKILYVGGLHKSVTEDMLRDLFSVAGSVQSIKILFDKNRPGFNYAFIEYDNTQSAEMAFLTLNGRAINNSEIKINWAFQSQQVKSTEAFNLFVGDLSPEVDDDLLSKTFAKFGNLIQAHVMWDMQTGRSRGYGFVSFSDSADAEKALQTMQGEWISGRAIRLNWASHKQNAPRDFRQQSLGGASPLQAGAPVNAQMGVPVLSPQSFELVLRQTPSWQTTVYLGNLAHFTTQNELIPLLQNFGFIVDFKFHPERGCAFVKYDSHERATLAIVQLAGFNVNGRPLKCGWGKDRPPNMQYNGFRGYGRP